MALVDSWDVSKPAGSDNLSQGDDEMRTHWRALYERLRRGHVWDASSTIDPNAGVHAAGQDPDGDANEFVIFENDGTTRGVTFRDSGAGANPSEWDFEGNTIVDAPNITSGNNPGHKHDFTIAIPLLYSATGRVTTSAFLNLGAGDLEILSARVGCATAPTGGAETLTLLVSNSTILNTDDPDSVAATAMVLSAALTIDAGEFYSDEVTVSSGGTINDGDLLIPNVSLIGATTGAGDVVLYLEARRG